MRLREDKNAVTGLILKPFPKDVSCVFVTINSKEKEFLRQMSLHSD